MTFIGKGTLTTVTHFTRFLVNSIKQPSERTNSSNVHSVKPSHCYWTPAPCVCLASQPSPSSVEPETESSDSENHFSSFRGGRSEPSLKKVLTEGLVLAADVSPVAVSLQPAEQEAVVYLSAAVGLVPAGDLSHLHVSWGGRRRYCFIIKDT